MGREVRERFKRKGSCVYLWLIHVEVWQKSTQYHKAIILQLKIIILKTHPSCNSQKGSLTSRCYWLKTEIQAANVHHYFTLLGDLMEVMVLVISQFLCLHCLHHNSCHTLRCSPEEQLGAWILEPPYWVKPQLCTLACSLHPIIKPLWTLSLHLWNSADNSTCLMQSWGLHKALRLCLECRLSLFWSSSPSQIYRENNMKLRRPCTKQSKFFFY